MPDSVPTPEPRPATAGAGLPPWLPLAALAVVPALIVGILVYALAGGDSGSGGGGNAAGIVDGIVGLKSNSNQRVESYKGRLHPDFPADFDLYGGSKAVVSFAVVSAEGTSMISFLTTSASIDDVYEYFQKTLDEDPWQLEFGQLNDEGAVVQFSRPDNADVSGAVVLYYSELDDVTSIRIHYEDVSAALTPGTGASNFQVGQSRPLPPGFPSDIPVYEADAGTIVLDTGFQRGQGGQAFAVTFLTKDSQDDVIKFYTDEFGGRGWTTTDTSPGGTSFAVSVDFADKAQTVSGSVSADSFEDDSAYTKVELVVQVTSGRRGN
ncbi:MAG TPA: hypothetical protein VI876_02540 [Dehalococcoidia bacterium]|nr:hypothetical protein [Dehalococcoidia bacterium]